MPSDVIGAGCWLEFREILRCLLRDAGLSDSIVGCALLLVRSALIFSLFSFIISSYLRARTSRFASGSSGRLKLIASPG